MRLAELLTPCFSVHCARQPPRCPLWCSRPLTLTEVKVQAAASFVAPWDLSNGAKLRMMEWLESKALGCLTWNNKRKSLVHFLL